MILLGLILVLIAVAAAVLLFLATDTLMTPIDLEAAGFQVGMTPLALLIAGAAIMLLLWLGLAMIRGSVRRRSRPRREAKEAQRQAEFEENIRADERSRAEEMHQQTLADRDRVKEQEFESRWAERDRERDEEFRSRSTDDEARIRADERATVERELAERQAVPAEASPSEGRHAAAGAGLGAAAATDRPYDRQRDTDASDVTADDTQTRDDVAAASAASDDAADDRTQVLGEDPDDGRHERTVADKIMHRD